MEKITYSDDGSVKLAYNQLRQLTEIQDWLGITKIETDDMGRTEKGEAGITAGKEDLFEVGLSEEYDYLTGKITPKIGVSGVDWDGTLKSSFGGDVYAGIGGAYILDSRPLITRSESIH